MQTLDSPSLVLAEKIETMDFSMPSYGDTLKGDTAGVKEAPGIPNFNPFGSREEPKEEEPAAAVEQSSKADEKAAAEARKADEKAAAEAKKADEKAAAEAKKAEEKAAAEAKKAEKEARRAAEMEKQKEAAERSKQKEADKAAAAASVSLAGCHEQLSSIALLALYSYLRISLIVAAVC